MCIFIQRVCLNFHPMICYQGFGGIHFSCIFLLNILASASMASICLSPMHEYGDTGSGCFNESTKYHDTRIDFYSVDMNGILALIEKDLIVPEILYTLVTVTYVM